MKYLSDDEVKVHVPLGAAVREYGLASVRSLLLLRFTSCVYVMA